MNKENNINEVYTLIDEKSIDEINSIGKYYRHNKTKAQVLVLENDDDNKTFGIGFKTPPTDSTGAAHIVEHSALSGSRKYKTKEPFMDLIKSSLQTFLNAMTFSDKTIYPVSSRNEKDFYNLMDVYLDAVFYPAIYDKKEIFLQEGWHYEIFSPEEEIKINGVVYNEMKGVYSGAENQVSDAITFNLHKDSSYGHDSGGDPREIPHLTYENFLDFHKKYYHPSNSYIYLYGDMDYAKALEYIDENYLSNFNSMELNSQGITNPSFEDVNIVKETYSTTEEEYGEDKSFAAYSVVLGNSDNNLDSIMRSILAELLVESESAPLKEVIMEANIGEDFYTETSASLPLDLTFVLKNMRDEDFEKFIKTIETSLEELVTKGIDKKLLESTLNKFEFVLREGGGSNKGIIYYIRALNSWLYENSPFDALSYNELISQLKAKVPTNFFEDYVQEKIIDNPFKQYLLVSPEIGKSQSDQEKLEEELRDFKESLSDSQLQDLIDENNRLKQFQESEDEDAKDTIPSLSLEDISPGVKTIEREEDKILDEVFMYNEQFANGISYLDIVFPLKHLKQEEIHLATVLTELLTKMDTNNYSYQDLNNTIYLNSGGIRFNTDIVNINNSSDYYPYLIMSTKVLNDKLEGISSLLQEVTLKTIYDNKKRIRDLLLMSKSQIDGSILQMGHTVALSRVKSYYLESAAYDDDLQGLNYYFYLSNLLDNFDEVFEDFLIKLTDTAIKIFNKKDIILHFTGEREVLDQAKTELEKYVKVLPTEKYEESPYPFEPTRKNEGFTSSANVQYVSKGYNIKNLGLKYTGDLAVLQNFLSNGYLHNSIRAKGGAYGSGIRFSRDGNVGTYSYRDPNLKNTIDVYDNIGEYLEKSEISDRDLNNLIIGVMNSFDPVLTPEGKGIMDLMRYISNTPTSEIERLKEEALSTTADKLKSFAPMLNEAMKENYVTVLGNENTIKENSNIFNNILPLKK